MSDTWFVLNALRMYAQWCAENLADCIHVTGEE